MWKTATSNPHIFISIMVEESTFHLKRAQPTETILQQAKSTDRDKLTVNKLTAKRRFRYSGFVTDFIAVILSQSEGLGKMALGIV